MKSTRMYSFAMLLSLAPSLVYASVKNGEFNNGTASWSWFRARTAQCTDLSGNSNAVDLGTVRNGMARLAEGYGFGSSHICSQMDQGGVAVPNGTRLSFRARLGDDWNQQSSNQVALTVDVTDQQSGLQRTFGPYFGQSRGGMSAPEFQSYSLDVSDFWGRTVKVSFRASTSESYSHLGQPLQVASPASIDDVQLVSEPLSPQDRYLWMVPEASSAGREGFVRITSRDSKAGKVTLFGIDSHGGRSGKATFMLGPRQSKHFTAVDLEGGNPAKGLEGKFGNGNGDWTVVVRTGDLKVEPQSYVRTPSGFLTSVHDSVWSTWVDWFVPTFNPASNPSQVSKLRLINTSLDTAEGYITGTDDSGWRGQQSVGFSIAPLAALELTAADLENGNPQKGLVGRLGDGSGKWRLVVSSTEVISAQSLLLDPNGMVTNLSTLPPVGSGVLGQSRIWFLPPASNTQQQGFVRVTNQKDRSNRVVIRGYDDAGKSSRGEVSVVLPPRGAVHLTSQDLERGNASKGLVGSLGDGAGNWRLSFGADYGIETSAYIRTPDGALAAIHDVVAGDGRNMRVPMFNPAKNPNQVSSLRIVNPNASPVQVQVSGTDDSGNPGPGGAVALTVQPYQSVEVSASDLEKGNPGKGLTGKIGSGTGKWVLNVTASAPVRLLSLMRDVQGGYLTNLSVGTADRSGSLEPNP